MNIATFFAGWDISEVVDSGSEELFDVNSEAFDDKHKLKQTAICIKFFAIDFIDCPILLMIT